jgi:exodeoxyribonuclease VII large subunit
VCWRSTASRLRVKLADGMRVVVTGRLTVYESRGQYQMVVEAVREEGRGDLQAAFERLKEKLEAEGLFDPARKRALPRFPLTVAVVTSPSGAAVRDVTSTLARRWPCASILLVPVHVQGEQASGEIAAALELVGRAREVDVVIVGRGGGSLEDLWAFNEEVTARAIAGCPVPVVSAVGHETDFTIADFVADVRAATPTAAAEIVAPQLEEVMGWLDLSTERMTRTLGARIDLMQSRLSELVRSYALGRIRSRIEHALQSVDYSTERLRRGTALLLAARRAALGVLTTRLGDLDPRSVLARGYAICDEPASGRLVASARDAALTGTMRVRFSDGNVLTEVKGETE